MSDLPWLDDANTGCRVGTPSVDEIGEAIGAIRKNPIGLLASQSELHASLLSFADEHGMEIHRRSLGDRELWTLGFDYDRMERRVVVGVRKEGVRLLIDVRSEAIWNWFDPQTGRSRGWMLREYFRWFTVTGSCPSDLFVQTLALARKDAQTYHVSDLRIEPVERP